MKSKSSRRKLHIQFHENQDFWTFYLANKEDVDYIIDASCRMFKKIVPTEDMKQDILIRLYRSEFLDRYDPTKARLNTYITSLVRGYAKSIAERENPNLFQAKHSLGIQVLDSDLNSGTTNSPHLGSEDNAGLQRLERRFLSELVEKLDEPFQKLFKLLMQDKSHQKVARLLKVSSPCISIRCNMLLKKLRELAHEELDIREELGVGPTREKIMVRKGDRVEFTGVNMRN